ncbi:MAG: hypothetical protein KatS3mg062_1367 [Tepidiforma sp.]|nr:MAG: hypothetical protein KatS3mg062_1367 [Tepidiforma sp.]
MSTPWAAVLLVGLGTVVIKAAGVLLLSGSSSRVRSAARFEHLAPAVLAALVVTASLSDGSRLVLDERSAGLAAAAAVLARRGPLFLAVGTAALVTALLRQL